MLESRNWPRIVLAAALAAAVSNPVQAARRGESEGSAPARVGVFADQVLWEPQRDFDGATLIVSGPEGEVHRRTFEAGTPPLFRLSDLKAPPRDGSYLWEVRFSPRIPPVLREALVRAAENEDFARTAELNGFYGIRHGQLVQTGQFRIHGGRIEAEEDGPDAGEPEGVPMRATTPRGPRGPLATFDVSGDWTLTDDLGIGTDVPSQEIDIVDASPTIQMQDSPSGFSWFVTGNDSGFDVRRTANATSDRVLFLHPAAPKPSLWVNSAGNWGNGTSMPGAPLEVTRVDGTGRVLVQELAAMTAARTLFELRNNGPTFFTARNTNAGVTWSFSVSGVGAFQVDNPAILGGAEMVFFNNGSVRMGPGGTQRFLLDPVGNLTISGNLVANGVFYASDRDLKENFASVDPKEVLSKVVDLPISRWNYKSERGPMRHIGPMADDFQTRFETGGPAGRVNLADLTGAALAAIQGLHQAIGERDARLAAMDERVNRQRAEIEELRERLAKLEALTAGLTKTANPTPGLAAGSGEDNSAGPRIP